MEINITKTGLEEIRPLRILFLHENNFQFIYNKCYENHWSDSYLFTSGETRIGYGSLWGKDKREDRDAIFEFYIIPPFRKFSNIVFPWFVSVSGASFIECQSNDLFLSSILYEYTQNINAEAILFEDDHQTNFDIPGVVFRKRIHANNIDEPSEYFLEQNGEVVGTSGFVWNYNMPYIDMFYEVRENFRRRGFASLMVQELKKEAYLMGRVPAARCNIDNKASKATLLKAGLKVCGFILTGEIKRPED